MYLSGLHSRPRGGSHFHIRLWDQFESQFCDVLTYGIFGPFVETISTAGSELGAPMGGNGSYTSTMPHGYTKPKGKLFGFGGMGVEVSVKVVGASGGVYSSVFS